LVEALADSGAEGVGLTADYAVELRSEATAVTAAAEGLDGVPAGLLVDQRALDHQDGVCIALISRILTAFRGAHGRDGTIVVPQTRSSSRLYTSHHTTPRRAAKGGAKPPATTPPATPPATGSTAT
jgi:hypothetical protein